MQADGDRLQAVVMLIACIAVISGIRGRPEESDRASICVQPARGGTYFGSCVAGALPMQPRIRVQLHMKGALSELVQQGYVCQSQPMWSIVGILKTACLCCLASTRCKHFWSARP